MFYYTSKGLAAHTENMERVDYFLKFFIERCVEDVDYYYFMEEALKREDNSENNSTVVKRFKGMIKRFKDLKKEDWKDIFAKQRQEIEQEIEYLMPYIPQEPFAGMTYPDLKEG